MLSVVFDTPFNNIPADDRGDTENFYFAISILATYNATDNKLK